MLIMRLLCQNLYKNICLLKVPIVDGLLHIYCLYENILLLENDNDYEILSEGREYHLKIKYYIYMYI